MRIWKIASISLIIVFLFITASLIYYNLELEEEIGELKNKTTLLKEERMALQHNITFLQTKVEKLKLLFQNLSESRVSELRDPSWEELKTFLEIDNTNELIYNNETFDCTGFAIELFKRARINGLRCGFVELRFEKERAHTLNVFRTTDEGLIFIDVTGDENGTGRDSVAYVKIGKPYGTIALEGIRRRRVACNLSCSDFAKELNYVNYPNPFDYNYFIDFKKCVDFYEECVDAYNKAVEEYNMGVGKYTYEELNRWLENLKVLERELGSENIYFISEMDEVKGVEIYW